MDARYIALAIPVFFVLIVGELFVNRAQGDLRYRFHDSINNLSCGVGQQVLLAFFKVVEIGVYTWVFSHARLTTISARSVGAWVAIVFALDGCYYWYHRASHRVNFLWAEHVVHHQSEEYNLSAALRQSWFGSLTSFVFYLPLALVGFPPLMYVAMQTFDTLYQFWIHTRAVRRCGPLETVLNTPSHHRVHHGVDPRYIDKNYAGIFILWDRLFGTFIDEADEPVYGTVKPLSSWNPVWANFSEWARLVRAAAATRRLRDKIAIFFAPPEWRPADLGGVVTIPEVSRATQVKYESPTPHALNAYVAAQFGTLLFGATAYLWYQEQLPRPQLAAAAAVIVAGITAWGALFEGRRWGVALELVRLAALPALAWWLANGTRAALPATVAAGGFALVCGVTVLRVGRVGRSVAR